MTKADVPVPYQTLPPLEKLPLLFKHAGHANEKKMPVVKSMKSSLALCPVGCLTCRVPESPSARVCRHTQNRRRYSLSARSQGGAPEPRKKQSHGGSEDGQIHCRGGRPAITRGGGSSNDTKLGLMKWKITFQWPLCSPSVRFLYLL